MAESFTLDAQPRAVVGKKVGALRRSGLVPAVVYGAKTEPFNLQIPYRALQVTLMKAGGTHIINLNVQGQKPQMVIARSVQRDVIKGNILHVDFLAVDATTKIVTEVPVVFVGESPAVKSGAGVLLNGIQTIEVEALPADLIDRVEVNLSSLKSINDSIHVRDLKLGDKVAILSEPDEMIVRVMVQEEVEEEAAEEVYSSEPEVLKKGKTEEETEE